MKKVICNCASECLGAINNKCMHSVPHSHTSSCSNNMCRASGKRCECIPVKKEKVFCKGCKHLFAPCDDITKYQCWCMTYQRTHTTFYGERIEYGGEPSILNKNNDCQYKEV